MTDQQPPKSSTAVDELRIEIDELVFRMRSKLEEEMVENSESLSLLKYPIKRYQSLNFTYGQVTALLLKQDIEEVIRQRRELRAQARWMGLERIDKPAGKAGAEQGESGAGTGAASPPRPVNFPPVANGIDYLQSVVHHLTMEPEPQPRDLKYAVLHLYAATEVLFKARLSQEHWALVWAEPKQATVTKHERRDFKSCGVDKAIERLIDVLGIPVSTDGASAVAKLGKTRNQLQHDGLTQSALAIEAQAAEVLDFLLAFLHQHLERHVDVSHAEALEAIKEKVGDINAFVKQRKQRLSRDLAPESTVQCPDCDEWALVINGDARTTCHFCDTSTESYRMAARYAETVLGRSEYLAVKDGDEPPVRGCASCPETAMVAGVITLAQHRASTTETPAEQAENGGCAAVAPSSKPGLRYLCFTCANSWDSTELAPCAHCGTLREITEDCDLCWECESLFHPSF
ncbi:hypothetical protein [Streptomyces umbrinus]|uniref:hypothetical protein n=1 Tax=Streptomyces umbrinus TaxID=67370 RepID=UPI0033E4F042